MRNRIRVDAFRYYIELGPARSYTAVAKHFGVSVRGVTKRAVKEGWKAQLAKAKEVARAKIQAKAMEDVAAIDERHLRMARSIQARALETLKNAPMGTGAAAVRALDVGIKIERAILSREKMGTGGKTLEDILIEARRQRDEKGGLAALIEASFQPQAKLPPATDVSPALLPRVVSEN